jgi:hypothetical protein
MRRNNLLVGLAVLRAGRLKPIVELTSSIVTRVTPFHRLVELEFPPIGFAKSLFQVHGVDTDGAVVIRRRIGRTKVVEFFTKLPPCLVGMGACAANWLDSTLRSNVRFAPFETTRYGEATRISRLAA